MTEMDFKVIHKAVLLKESIEYLRIKPDGVYADCTLGDGGHSFAIYQKLREGRIISLDVDSASISFVTDKFKTEVDGKKWIVIRENFSKLLRVAEENGVPEFDGILFDLGLSSRQIEDSQRGFSYQGNAESVLDMRMDDRLSVKASDLLRVLNKGEIVRLLQEYGEERYAKRIANAVKDFVETNPDLQISVNDILKIVRRVVPAAYREGTKNPAMRVFQALRIAVNDELACLSQGLEAALSLVAKSGRIVVLSYHSLEDRIVKEVFRDAEEDGKFNVITEKPVVPSPDEISANSRARSAKMRVIERIK